MLKVFKAVVAIPGTVPSRAYQPFAEAALYCTDFFLLYSILACQADEMQAFSIYQNWLTVNRFYA